MTVYNDVLQAVIGMMNDTGPYATIVIGSNVPSNGICVLPTGAAPSAFFNKQMLTEWVIALNGKNSDQNLVYETLNTIHTSLTMTKTYPSADNFQIYDIETVSSPSLIGRQENDQWIYGSSLRIKFYMKGA